MFGPPRLGHGASRVLYGQRRYKSSSTQTRDEFRGFLRKLLREASYLPDTTARSYFHQRIITKFRAYQPPEGSSNPNESPVKRNWNAAKLLENPGKVERLRIQARQTLILLARANAGRFKDVDRVLDLAYGRDGPLRERLLQPYLQPDEPKDDTALRASIPQSGSQRPETTKGNPRESDDGLPSALIALVKAQIQHQGQVPKPKVLRYLYPNIPKKNMWGRPMPLRRVRNMKWRHYLHLKQRVLPPLPREQWERLRRLCSGEEHWEGRARPRPISRTYNIPIHDRRLSAKNRKPLVKRKIDQRFMRHRYRTLFCQSPCMAWNPTIQKWKVDYGHPTWLHVPPASSSTLGLFGINGDVDDSQPDRNTTQTSEAG